MSHPNLHYDFDNFFLLIISLKTIWKKRLIFSILISEIWFFNFEVSLFFPRKTPQTAVDMKWCPCAKELSRKAVSWFLYWCQEPILSTKRFILWILKHPIFTAFQWYLVYSLLQCWKQGQVLLDFKVACDRSSQEDSETNSGVIHSKDSALVH